MKVLGLDLAGPAHVADTCLAVFEAAEDSIRLADLYEGADDEKILAAVARLGGGEPPCLGIDAPLSYQPGGGDRPADAALRARVRFAGRAVGVMTPTMTRMVYLTLHGMGLVRLLESLRPACSPRIVEVHPGASMLLRGADPQDVRDFKRRPAARGRLLRWLERTGGRGVEAAGAHSDHLVAACAAAGAAWQWHLGKAVWRYPAAPPHHPYDFAC
jgi:predicted nuclease with RNAse H fold